ncbi:hypothetical protein ACJMK2_026018 [Sinanodonta woodiana]|uniref:RING-type domain-containing protein n=1 Tax=Sinanodonta woodiana TaxID=1069815 RepID=A0ABD3XJU2_SINWO
MVLCMYLALSGASTLKYVCPGDSVQAFQNIAFDSCNARVSLYINGNRNTEIATWLSQNCTLNETRLDAYKDRVFLDQNGTITIHNFHHFDQGKYVVISKKDTLPSIQEVQLFLMVAPLNDCKPMIVRLGNKLLASLKPDNCGTPVATLYWKGFGGVSDTNGSMLKITPGTETRTYYACIQGPALRCARNQTTLDNCSPFVIEGNTSRTVPSESSNSIAYITIIIVLGVILMMVIVVIVILIRKHRRRSIAFLRSTYMLLDTASVIKKSYSALSIINRAAFYIIQNTNPNLNIGFATRKGILQGQRHTEFEMNEVETDHPSGIDPETIRELQELRDAALCKICFANKTSVCFMPCYHVATCDKCSISLDNCPVCRASIKERKTICFDSNE